MVKATRLERILNVQLGSHIESQLNQPFFRKKSGEMNFKLVYDSRKSPFGEL